MIVAYTAVCAASQALWLTFAAITTETARHYGVSVGAVGWLAEIFPLLYVLLAIPCGILLDRWFRPALGLGGALVAAGGLLRLGGDTFAWAMAGQVVVALAQPLVVSAVSKLAGEYLPPEQRAAGISIGSAGGFVGMVLALVLGPTVGAHGQLGRLLALQALLALIPAVVLAAALWLRAPAFASEEHAAIDRGTARTLWGLPEMRTLCGLVFIGFGIFVALATWLQTLLAPDGVSEAAAGGLLVAMVIAGVIGCAVLAPLVERRGSARAFMRLAAVVGCLGCVALAVVGSLGLRAAVVVVMGLLVLPALPVILTRTERLAGPLAGSAGALVWMAGNLGGLVVALLVQTLVHDQLAAFLAMAAMALLGLPLAGRLRRPGPVRRADPRSPVPVP